MDRKRNEIARSLSMVTQLGISMLAPLILCVCVGIWLDDTSRARRARHYGGCAEHMDAGAAGRTATPEEEEKG